MLLLPQLTNDWPHVPRCDGFDEQRMSDVGEVVPLAVVQQFMQLLGSDARQPAAQLSSYIGGSARYTSSGMHASYGHPRTTTGNQGVVAAATTAELMGWLSR